MTRAVVLRACVTLRGAHVTLHTPRGGIIVDGGLDASQVCLWASRSDFSVTTAYERYAVKTSEKANLQIR